jgi:orotate phosphoribosyltransferase
MIHGFFPTGGGFFISNQRLKVNDCTARRKGRCEFCDPKRKQPMKRELIDMLCRKSFRYSEEPVFKLVSGKLSNFYVNCKPTTLSARGMYLAGHLVYDALEGAEVSAVGGLTFGADPIAIATAFTSELRGRRLNAFSVRKTPKDHGIIRWIEGDVRAGQRVAVIDDVATTGGSTIKAIERAQQEGLSVAKVVVLVDRQEGGLDAIARRVNDVTAIVTRSELFERWHTLAGTSGAESLEA